MVHIHPTKGGFGIKAEFTIVDGKIGKITYRAIQGKPRMGGSDLNDLNDLVEARKYEIMEKFIDVLIEGKAVKPETITRL